MKFILGGAVFLMLTLSISPASGQPRVGIGGQIGSSSFIQLSSKVWLNSRFGSQVGWAYFPTLRESSVSLKGFLKLFELPRFFNLPIILTNPSFSALAGRTILPHRLFLPSNSYLGFELENGPPFSWFIQFLSAYYDTWPNFDSPNRMDPSKYESSVEFGFHLFF